MKKFSLVLLSLWAALSGITLPAYARHHHHGGDQPTPVASAPAPILSTPSTPSAPTPATPATSSAPSADASLPSCMDGNKALPVINDQVIQWKTTTPNQYLARARVQGPITKVYPDKTGHDHFEIQIGSGAQATIEVIYNNEFGALPDLQPGMQVDACGDYITSYAQAGGYQPSPDGAIIHWIHRNPKGVGHPDGYVAIDGKLYGQGNGNGH